MEKTDTAICLKKRNNDEKNTKKIIARQTSLNIIMNKITFLLWFLVMHIVTNKIVF